MNLPSNDFKLWRQSARQALSLGVPPERFDWQLPGLCVGDERLAVVSPIVPGTFLNMARLVAMHSYEDRWVLLYWLLWRLHHGEPKVMSDEQDPMVAKALVMRKAVERDIMKMQAFVRFRQTHDLNVAWHKSDHNIAEEVATFFICRYPDRPWILHTPQMTMRWTMRDVEFSAGLPQPPRFLSDDHEEVWQRYYRAQFDPTRARWRMSGARFTS